MRALFPAFFALIIGCCAAGCGRYGYPKPPELFSPRAVQDLRAAAGLEGVRIEWAAPSKDRQGEELASMDGYSVYRKLIERPSDMADDEIEYELLAEIPDTHIEVLKELRKKAREEGRVSRSVKVDPQLMQFSYVDASPVPGRTYIYKIVPVNQGGEEGQVQRLVKVIYRGDASVVSIVDSGDIEAEADELGRSSR